MGWGHKDNRNTDLIHGMIDREVSVKDNVELCKFVIVREIEEILLPTDSSKAPSRMTFQILL